ncbi:MAG: hypothetical protein ACI97A_001599 [Planctomycetota bacterium]|jgi:hypothetical protein
MQRIKTFKHRIVRDLAWTILSPPLVDLQCETATSASIRWCRRQFDAFLPQLRALDADPAPLQEKIDIEQSYRLGKYFENLIAYWLEASDDFELLERNLQIRDGKETLGEMDFLVLDLKDQKTSHWEVAVKFYLGFPSDDALTSWHGPGKRDNLARKMGHLTAHQLQRSSHPVAIDLLRDKGHEVNRSFLFVKGRLFHERSCPSPLPQSATPSSETGITIHANHLHSWWAKASEFADFGDSGDQTWHQLTKPNWLVDQSDLDVRYEPGSFDSLVELGRERPIYVVSLEDGQEKRRGFVVPDDWCDELERS